MVVCTCRVGNAKIQPICPFGYPRSVLSLSAGKITDSFTTLRGNT